MKYKAFTLIELVFVIVVLGIMAALAIPRMERDIRQEAADNILSAIRYTKHMALLDDVTDPRNADWQKAFWRFGVRTCLAAEGDVFYYVGSDENRGGNIDNAEAAVDPLNGKRMLGAAGTSCASGVNNGASPNIFISHKYGIKNTNMFTGCGGGDADAARYVGFDHMGRPHTGFSGSSTPDYSTVLTSNCDLTFKFDDTSIPDLVIRIEKGTGHAYIVGQNDS
ncbi:hypothetical protein YH65_02525 [Sulfurovum lithotrophicum]|uniref:Type II/IV secretion system protein n=1 Tax=Sulfurovum lithotrophicum TaxID=206403 RepID=A0A7U4M054_9BACT|nr:prepilin-type N-terminal cleavage/methylation domain-containing protein [Sulfurovum lithotrophicum]AKF24394.1 hypothetical protein YH65_02525 [Sulfurovum lithotrophicum]